MMIIREVQAKTILSVSKIHDYVVNPYVGCQHACSYCYARFMKRFTGHQEPWGEFVDVKINAPELLSKEILKKKVGNVWVSGVCDPYQPLEAKYQLTRRCLAILAQHDWPVVVQTRSPQVLRDIDCDRTISRTVPQLLQGGTYQVLHIRRLAQYPDRPSFYSGNIEQISNQVVQTFGFFPGDLNKLALGRIIEMDAVLH